MNTVLALTRLLDPCRRPGCLTSDWFSVVAVLSDNYLVCPLLAGWCLARSPYFDQELDNIHSPRIPWESVPLLPTINGDSRAQSYLIASN